MPVNSQTGGGGGIQNRAARASPRRLKPPRDSLKTAHWAVFLARIDLIGSNPPLLSPQNKTGTVSVPVNSQTGGGGGIRTPVTRVAGQTVFETAAFNHSATPPRVRPRRSYEKAPCETALRLSGGEMGIRTPDTLLAHTRFPIVLLRPARTSLHCVDCYAYCA